ncbi:hypothetical protein ES288_D09G144000v1 [Gossypium darwinii]|uniref:Uncharacterized protein n=1 Tax=Gossypium darwinii TaxID=34276 RepID=A0A5D2BED5_GOSDA|nr:hypothetical protein ES288_D09G144000v1 [Gossypium darwinii]
MGKFGPQHPRRERQLRLDPIKQSGRLPPPHQICFSEENNMGNRHHLLLPAEKITIIPDAPKKCKQRISFMPRFTPPSFCSTNLRTVAC